MFNYCSASLFLIFILHYPGKIYLAITDKFNFRENLANITGFIIVILKVVSSLKIFINDVNIFREEIAFKVKLVLINDIVQMIKINMTNTSYWSKTNKQNRTY